MVGERIQKYLDFDVLLIHVIKGFCENPLKITKLIEIKKLVQTCKVQLCVMDLMYFDGYLSHGAPKRTGTSVHLKKMTQFIYFV